MADITANGNGNGKLNSFQKKVTYPVIKDIILFAALLGAIALFVKLSSDIAIVKTQVQELIDIHPRVQGGNVP